MLLERYFPSEPVSLWTGPRQSTLIYENLTFILSGNLVASGNGTTNVSIFKMSGAAAWDNQAYTQQGFTPPVTLEFNKWCANFDNGRSYAMIGWNTDPTTDASYTSIDYASYPFTQDRYEIYNNNTYINPSKTFDKYQKFYLTYKTDGTLEHYNGSSLLYSVNTGSTVQRFIDSSFYSVGAMFGGFSNIRVIRRIWNGSVYL